MLGLQLPSNKILVDVVVCPKILPSASRDPFPHLQGSWLLTAHNSVLPGNAFVEGNGLLKLTYHPRAGYFQGYSRWSLAFLVTWSQLQLSWAGWGLGWYRLTVGCLLCAHSSRVLLTGRSSDLPAPRSVSSSAFGDLAYQMSQTSSYYFPQTNQACGLVGGLVGLFVCFESRPKSWQEIAEWEGGV